MKRIIEFDNTGMTRMVFLTKNHAIKIPRVLGYSKFYGLLSSILTGWDANRTEYVWSKYNKIEELCPVKFSILGSLLIVMPRCKLITEHEFKTIEKSTNFHGYEHKQASYGWLEGKLMIIDYGNC